jgi:hypothetical protein
MGWSVLFHLKNTTNSKLIRIFYTNMRINVEPRIVSSLLKKHIKFDCETLGNILGISKKGPKVFKIKIIPTMGDFGYDEAVIIHTRRRDFAPKVKNKSQEFLLQPRLLHRIIAHDILP